MSTAMNVIIRILTMILCVRSLRSTFTYQDDRGFSLHQQVAQPILGRIVYTNRDTDISVEEANYGENKEGVHGVKCTIGRLFYLTEKGRLMRCDTNKLSVDEQPASEQDPPHLLLPGLPTVGLTFNAGARLPGTVQNQDISGDGGIDEKKPVVIKPKPAVVKPIKLKPVLVKPVHKPEPVHKPFMHLPQHSTNSLLHVTVPGLTFYHQTGLNSVNYEELVREKGLGWNTVYPGGYPYWYFMPPHREAIIQKLPAGAERILPARKPAVNSDPDPIVSDDVNEGEGMMRSEIDDNTTEHTVIDDYRTHIIINPLNKSSFESKSDLTANYATGEGVVEQKTKGELNSANATDVNYREELVTLYPTSSSDIKKEPEEFRLQEDDPIAVTTMQSIEEPKTEVYQVEAVEEKPEEVAEEGVQGRSEELSLSEGPDVIEDANKEQEAAQIRKIREAPGIPIDTLNDQQNPSNSILNRNTLLNIMSSLKEQYLKNAEPDQRKLIEDAFDRLHCSVRGMEKLDERHSRKKSDSPKKAALKLLAERAQPLIEELDYYSDTTDDVSAEHSFLELLNVANRHIGKQSIESE